MDLFGALKCTVLCPIQLHFSDQFDTGDLWNYFSNVRIAQPKPELPSNNKYLNRNSLACRPQAFWKHENYD